MTKKSVKEFVKKHKRSIVTGCVYITVAGVYYIVTAKERANRKLFYERLKLVSNGCTSYNTIFGKEVCKFMNDCVIEDRSGNKLDVEGIMFFGNPVEA